MEASNLKNMVVLKNLPSNIVDEAIIILKNSKKIKKLEKVENNKTTNKKEKQTTQKDYILKEAEMLVNSYVSKIENKEDKKFADNKMQQKYKKIVTSCHILKNKKIFNNHNNNRSNRIYIIINLVAKSYLKF